MGNVLENRLKSLLLPALILFCAACSTPEPPTLKAEEILEQSAGVMGGLEGFHFLIDRSGAPAFLSEAQSISFRRAEGDFVAPGSAQAAVRVIAPGLIVELQAISLEGRYWETHVVSGEWQEYPAEQGFNPAILFEPQSGIPIILREDISDLSLIGITELEELPGLKLYEIHGQLDGERIYRLSYGLIGPDLLDVQVWIEPETYYLHRMSLTEPVPGEDEPSFWQVDMWDFGSVAEISQPDMAEPNS
jgi:hypothetical protein